MLRIAGRHARKIQSELQTTGHLFEKRYYPVPVDTDSYLLELLRHVHLDPVRAGMVRSARDYPWSSHHSYTGQRFDDWVTTDLALPMFHADREHAIEAYPNPGTEASMRVLLSAS